MMQQAVTPATPDSPESRAMARLLRRAAAAGVAAAMLALSGCGGGGGSEPREPRRPPLPQTRPATRATVPDGPATRPVRPSTAPTTSPTTLPTTSPATQPSTQPSTGPATQPDEATTRPATGPATEATGPEEPEKRLLLVENPTPQGAALAEIFAEYAELLGRAGTSEASALRQSAALQESAVRLAPRDARHARRLVSAQMTVGDVPASLEALEHYRGLAPDDVLAQIRYVDLSASQMEMADERIDYLVRVAQSDQVPDEVRSHAAATASMVLREALDERRADLLLEEAVRLDPYSPQALQLFYERLLATGEPRYRRVDALAMLARSNILQPAVLAALAQEVAGSGLLEPANELYRRAAQVHRAMGIPMPPELLRDMAALHLITNRPQSARQMLGLLEGRAFTPPQPATAPAPGQPPATPPPVQPIILAIAEIDGLMLQPMIADGPEARTTAAGRSANLIRAFGLMPINRALTGLAPAPPVADAAAVPQTPLPDVLTDAQRLASPELPAEQAPWRDVYATSLANLAWLDLYFLAQPTDPRILEALAVLVPPESLSLARLQGWQQWRQGQADAARETLSGLADRDALARLGLLLMEGAPDGEQAQLLLDSHPNGLVGAFLADALRPFGVLVLPGPDAPDVRAALATLPMVLFEMLEPATTREFYSLTSDPHKVRHEYSEPMLVTVTLRNSGQHPITVGPEGVLRPIVRLDAQVKGQAPQAVPVPAANALELWGDVRLDPGEKIEHAVRLDGPQVRAMLAQEPQMNVTVSGEVATNPALAQTEGGLVHVAGPAGQGQRLRRVMTRTGFPLELGNQQFLATFGERLESLRTGEPLERLRMAQWALGQIQALNRRIEERRQAAAPADEIAQLANLSDQMSGTLARAGASLGLSDEEAAANAWVKYCGALVSEGETRRRLLAELLTAPSFEARIVGLIAAASALQDQAAFDEMAAPLAEGDPDPTVRRLATELMTREGRQAATAPATQPATLPGSLVVPTTLPTVPATQPSTLPSP